MRFLHRRSTRVALLGLALALAAVNATAAGPVCPNDDLQASSSIVVREGFLGEQDRAALLARAGAATTATGAAGGLRKLLAVPGWLSNSLVAVLGRDDTAPSGIFAPVDADAEVPVPMFEVTGDHHEHQDRHATGPNRGALADGFMGVVYLAGDGDFILTDTSTGAEHRVPIAPGKLVSWANALFTHRVEGASSDVLRRMLGPMALDATSHTLVGVGTYLTCYDNAVNSDFTDNKSPQTTANACWNACGSDAYFQWNSGDQNCFCGKTLGTYSYSKGTTTYTSSGYVCGPPPPYTGCYANALSASAQIIPGEYSTPDECYTACVTAFGPSLTHFDWGPASNPVGNCYCGIGTPQYFKSNEFNTYTVGASTCGPAPFTLCESNTFSGDTTYIGNNYATAGECYSACVGANLANDYFDWGYLVGDECKCGTSNGNQSTLTGVNQYAIGDAPCVVAPPTLVPTASPSSAPTKAPTVAPPLCDRQGVALTGSATPTTVRTANRALLGFGQGPLVRYTVILANARKHNKTAAASTTFAQAGLVVTLPAGTRYLKGRVYPKPAAARHNKTLATPVYDATANTVTWPDAPLAARRKRKYSVHARVLPNAVAAGSPLVFAAVCPTCPQLATTSSVTVEKKTK